MIPNKNKKIKEDEKQKEEELQNRYTEYTFRIKARNEAGEKIEVKPFEQWIRKIGDKTVAGDSGETKREKFIRLIEARMNSALHELDLIINLASPQYESTVADHANIVNALRLKVLDIENSFKSQKKEKPEGFKLL